MDFRLPRYCCVLPSCIIIARNIRGILQCTKRHKKIYFFIDKKKLLLHLIISIFFYIIKPLNFLRNFIFQSLCTYILTKKLFILSYNFYVYLLTVYAWDLFAVRSTNKRTGMIFVLFLQFLIIINDVLRAEHCLFYDHHLKITKFLVYEFGSCNQRTSRLKVIIIIIVLFAINNIN